jgi:hypothetical protein
MFKVPFDKTIYYQKINLKVAKKFFVGAGYGASSGAQRLCCEPQKLRCEPKRLLCEPLRLQGAPPWLWCEPSQLPAFHFDADPGLRLPNKYDKYDTDPGPQHWYRGARQNRIQ